jgi:TonB family protein
MNAAGLPILIAACCILSGCESPKQTVPPLPPSQQHITFTPAPTNAHLRTLALDPKVDPVFAAYDRTLIEAVQNRWYQSLQDQHYQGLQQGYVTLSFRLHTDGKVSDVHVLKSSLNGTLTQAALSAVNDSAPFAAWTDAMRQKKKGDYLDVTFSFYYR